MVVLYQIASERIRFFAKTTSRATAIENPRATLERKIRVIYGATD